MSALLGYARVSKEEQNPGAQRLRLEEAGAVRVFEDRISGLRSDRPQLTAMLDYARPGDTILVVRLERLGRSLRDLIDLVEGFGRRGLGFRCLEQPVDTTTPGGKLMFQICGAFAEFDRNMIAARTRDAIAFARAEGKRLGRPPRDAGKLKAALTLVDAGTSPSDAAKAVGLGRSTLYQEIARRRLS
ncbi:recombinase family protein [Methylobacterium gnaphalii]|uniref:recombinase family protein n=1 Tax=Methylobacterium gnaphalii TaxID=1010610 RepID=UPI0011BDAB1F|nr:recombinase family protein [Methylobacterium gnaphalii]GJD69440.1 DNA-invertase hin [Methylobacterium gnaphalii]